MAEKKAQVTMSFRERQKTILSTMTRQSNGRVEEKVIKFRNDDVPEFLRNLDAYEERSSQKVLMVG